jgi:FkbM family methyltransferase
VGLDEASMSRLRALAARLPKRPVGILRTLWYQSQRLDPRRLWLHRRFQQLNAGAAGDEMVLRPGLRLGVDPQAREPFEWFCFRSPEMVAELDGFLSQVAGRRRLLDVGACHGLFALAFTQGHPDAAALAVEPSPLAWEVLESNLRRNAGARVTPVRAAVGAAPGILRMRFAWHHLEAASESPDSPNDPGTISIPVRTLDDLREELAFRPDVMKVDVEGYEIFALRGARRLLDEDRPLLFLEAHPQRIRELGGSMRELWDLLAAPGYRAFDLHGRPVAAEAFAALDSVSRFRFAPGAALIADTKMAELL